MAATAVAATSPRCRGTRSGARGCLATPTAQTPAPGAAKAAQPATTPTTGVQFSGERHTVCAGEGPQTGWGSSNWGGVNQLGGLTGDKRPRPPHLWARPPPTPSQERPPWPLQPPSMSSEGIFCRGKHYHPCFSTPWTVVCEKERNPYHSHMQLTFRSCKRYRIPDWCSSPRSAQAGDTCDTFSLDMRNAIFFFIASRYVMCAENSGVHS